MNILQSVLSILSGLIVIIPLIIELAKYIKALVKEKNWSSVVEMILNLMSEAEFKFSTGEERKAFVMAELSALAKTVNYDFDWEVISKMIDDLCAMAKKVNIN